MQFLDFEEPIAELLAMIDELRGLGNHDNLSLSVHSEIKALQIKVDKLTVKIFKKILYCHFRKF